jgi:hypothetical protein
MGIYSNCNPFGIRIYNFNDEFSNTLFEKKYDLIMSDEERKEAYLFYTELSDKNVFFHIYTECSSTYEKGVFMMWHPLSLDMFLQQFDV